MTLFTFHRQVRQSGERQPHTSPSAQLQLLGVGESAPAALSQRTML